MTDREKVIKAIENCIGQPKCFDCPWEECSYEHEIVNSVPYSLMRDALALLKEHDNCENCAIAIEDRQPVIRCKDCIYGTHEKNESTWMTWIYCGHHRENRPEDWFCADGERKEGR